MPKFHVEIEAEGFLTRMKVLLDRATHANVVLKNDVSRLIRRMLSKQFLSEGGAFGQKWAPLSRNYARQKMREAGNMKILQKTGKLFRAFTRGQGLKDVFVTAGGRDTLEVRADPGIKYWIFHQKGTNRMPRRMIVPDPLPDSFIQDVRGVFRNYLLQGVTSA